MPDFDRSCSEMLFSVSCSYNVILSRNYKLPIIAHHLNIEIWYINRQIWCINRENSNKSNREDLVYRNGNMRIKPTLKFVNIKGSFCHTFQNRSAFNLNMFPS